MSIASFRYWTIRAVVSSRLQETVSGIVASTSFRSLAMSILFQFLLGIVGFLTMLILTSTSTGRWSDIPLR
ncbi:hypothetical protein BDV33DRAFT_186036 [Aspergillus novoparasiticus]|uniref:Uncharacterized protein n=1 Tax=Aspergillus novoparasiticus TaxID=986946 RepID=A0A5N6E7P4_9EURO|nr:hypothetical protein BDV33DRAFT_186036 [Aspergillus novoparasiticus]